jgi:hypothetical protein
LVQGSFVRFLEINSENIIRISLCEAQLYDAFHGMGKEQFHSDNSKELLSDYSVIEITRSIPFDSKMINRDHGRFKWSKIKISFNNLLGDSIEFDSQHNIPTYEWDNIIEKIDEKVKSANDEIKENIRLEEEDRLYRNSVERDLSLDNYLTREEIQEEIHRRGAEDEMQSLIIFTPDQILKYTNNISLVIDRLVVVKSYSNIENDFAIPIPGQSNKYLTTLIWAFEKIKDGNCKITTASENQLSRCSESNYHLFDLFCLTIGRHNTKAKLQDEYIINCDSFLYIYDDYPPAKYSSFGEDDGILYPDEEDHLIFEPYDPNKEFEDFEIHNPHTGNEEEY